MVRGGDAATNDVGFAHHAGRAWKPSPYGVVGRCAHCKYVVRHPTQGASGTPPPTGGCETCAAGCAATDEVVSRLTNGARAVPAGLDTLGGGREAGAPWETPARLVTPNVCTQPTTAVTRPRGVEDAAPYGRQRNERCGI